MRLLLDTCALLWFAEDAEQLSARARVLLDDEENEVFVSVASYWEIVIKFHKGRLALPCQPDVWFASAIHADAVLPVDLLDVTALHALGPPTGHKDPWDRLLAATALRHALTVVTSDGAFSTYGVPVEW